MLTAQQRLAGLTPGAVQNVRTIEQALGERRMADAERHVVATLALAPQHPEVLRLFAVTQLGRNRPDIALQALRQAHAQRADDPLIHLAFGSAFEAIKDLPRSRESLRRACEHGPDLAIAWFSYGRRLMLDNDGDAAAPALRRAVELEPRLHSARVMLANLLAADGNAREAEREYRAIVADQPEAGYAWFGLATLRPMPLGADDLATMKRTVASAATTPAQRTALHFAMAIVLEEQGDFAGAFALMQAGHALARTSEAHDAAAFTRHIDGILDAFTPQPAGAATGQGNEVIFIASMPRSGSSLTEQILASHSQVEGGMELHELSQEIMDESDRVRAAFPHWVRTHSPEQWQQLGQRYLTRTQRWRARRPRMTDKMPANWMYVGTILAMLPEARVVICRRDPLETCLACYRYMFARHPYTHTFADLAAHWRDFDRAVRHWQKLYPGRVRVQVYEELVGDPESQIRELLAFCGLPFEAACLDFHATDRRVTTPSAAQVREPIRRDTARADKYGALLDPLRAALGMPPFQQAAK